MQLPKSAMLLYISLDFCHYKNIIAKNNGKGNQLSNQRLVINIARRANQILPRHFRINKQPITNNQQQTTNNKC
ncbi:MAG: hypothetical protein F6K14_03630 [Symploca sp. SIO2C1]|nr:hypothetical protein [Symploca sp. SIO2C1]